MPHPYVEPMPLRTLRVPYAKADTLAYTNKANSRRSKQPANQPSDRLTNHPTNEPRHSGCFLRPRKTSAHSGIITGWNQPNDRRTDRPSKQASKQRSENGSGHQRVFFFFSIVPYSGDRIRCGRQFRCSRVMRNEHQLTGYDE